MTSGEEAATSTEKVQTTGPQDVPSDTVLPTKSQPAGDYVGKSVDPSELLRVNQGNVAAPERNNNNNDNNNNNISDEHCVQ